MTSVNSVTVTLTSPVFFTREWEGKALHQQFVTKYFTVTVIFQYLYSNFISNCIISCSVQVNGKDLSKASHDEAVEAFRSAKDPIVVQVLRRNTAGRGSHVSSTQEVDVVDVVDMCTQTDITFEHIMALAKLRATTPPVPDICPFLLSDR